MKQKTLSSIQTLCLALSLAATTLYAVNPSQFSGSVLVRTSNAITTKNQRTGDSWVGSVAQDVSKDGAVVVRKGTPVTGTIENTKSSQGAPLLRLQLSHIGADPVLSAPYEAEAAPGERKLGRKMTGWALTGALVGGILHGGKGAAVGAAAGAGVGGLRGLSRESGEAVIAPETLLRFEVR